MTDALFPIVAGVDIAAVAEAVGHAKPCWCDDARFSAELTDAIRARRPWVREAFYGRLWAVGAGPDAADLTLLLARALLADRETVAVVLERQAGEWEEMAQ